MNEAKIIAALQEKYKAALKTAALTINTLSEAATPHWRGNLRDSKTVRINDWNDVDVITGNASTGSYVHIQYGVDQSGKEFTRNHEGNPDSWYKDLSQGGADGGGTGERAQYQRQYRKKRKDGTLQPSTAKWYHRVINDAESMSQVLNVFVQRFKR
jgi:autotransporter translocation and assembly factor TamB